MDAAVRPLLILGTGTFAEEIAAVACDVPGFEVVGFVENMRPERCEQALDDRPVHWIENLDGLVQDHWAVCGLGTTHRSRFTDQVTARGMRFATVVHPTARVAASCTLGEGTILSVGVIIASHTRLGWHVSVNRGAMIGHHTEIGDFVTIGPGANIAGNCCIKDKAYVGMGAIVIDHLTIGERCVIGAGAVVTTDVPDRSLVMGVPARVVKENIEGK